MSQKQLESTLNRNVVKWLNSLECCFAYKNRGTAFNKGFLDVSGCLNGIRIEIEGKIGSNKPTLLQQHYIDKWRAAGAITGWYNSLEDAKKLVLSQAKKKGIK